MLDVLDVQQNVLYCSRRCARKAGAKVMKSITVEEYDAQREKYSEDHWGALCPICEEPYHAF